MFKNADFIRNLPDIGARLYEALADLEQRTAALSQQVNGNTKGQPAAPPQISAVNVSGQDGHLHVAITDNSPIYRGIRYYVEHADNPHFVNPIVVPMHDSRNVTIPVGNQTRYVRAYSAYASSPPSAPLYHGGSQPQPVNGGGTGPGPRFLTSQGSGTGPAGAGLQGPGIAAFRGSVPPKR